MTLAVSWETLQEPEPTVSSLYSIMQSGELQVNVMTAILVKTNNLTSPSLSGANENRSQYKYK